MKIIDSLIAIVGEGSTSDTTLVHAYNDLAVQYATSDSKKARDFVAKAMALSQKTGYQRGLAGAENCLGIVYYYAREYDSAMVHYQRAMTINDELGREWGKASVMFQIGAVHRFKSEFTRAIDYFQSASDIFEKNNDSISLAKSLESIGACYNQMRYKAMAMEHYLKAIEIYELRENQEGIIRGYNHIGTMLLLNHEYKKALEYLEKALPYTKTSGDKNNISSLYSLMAGCHVGLGNYDMVLEFADHALELREHVSNTPYGNPRPLYYKGEAYRLLKNYPKALEFYKKVLGYNTIKTKKSIVFADDYNAMAQTYKMVGEFDSAVVNAKKAISLSKELSHLEGQIKGKTILASIAESQSNNGQAYIYYKELLALKDSFALMENDIRAEELKTIYETERKERMLGQQKLKINILEQEKLLHKIQRIAMIVGLFFVILVSVLFVRVSKQKVKKSKLKARYSYLEKLKIDDELARKRRELATITLDLAKKNKVMQELKQTIVTWMDGSDFEVDQEQGKQVLLKKIDEQLREQDNWEYFKQSFEKVHPDFYMRIKQKYPELTQNDLRMLSFLKMNLSSREIAHILNITNEGVKKAKYRLRKKMDLDSDDSMHDVLFG
jgi:tetratricopeptide (TPR) repeat protein